MVDLTRRQLALVTFWAAHTDERGYPPSFREAMAFLGIRSTNNLAEHIDRCEKKGLLKRTAAMRGRGVIVTALGRSLAGAPPPAASSYWHRHRRAEVRVRRELLRSESHAVRRVRAEGCVMGPLFLPRNTERNFVADIANHNNGPRESDQCVLTSLDSKQTKKSSLRYLPSRATTPISASSAFASTGSES